MASRDSFYSILTAAINDIAEHGYDSVARVEMWTDRIRKAAESSMRSAAQMEQDLRDALETVYRRLVTNGGALRTNPGVARFTIERVRPRLRAELDRRIVAAADLVKLNRDEAIDKTLRRFKGWSTSIPAGGTPEPEKAKTKESIRKSIAGLKFEERRLNIDQGHKLAASINAVVCIGGGAIAGRWHSHWRETGYDYRVVHKHRDDRIFLIRDSWAHEKGLVKPGEAGYTDQVTQPAYEPYCRCYYEYLFHLRHLPPDMITAKGREAMKATKAA